MQMDEDPGCSTGVAQPIAPIMFASEFSRLCTVVVVIHARIITV